MKYIGELLKGVVIGLANILPGISGGMLAISMGVYDTIIHAVNRLFKEPAASIRTLFPYGLGAVAGIVCLSLAFEYLFGRFPLQTKLAFIGLIGGGLPSLFKKAGAGKKGERAKGAMTVFLTAAVIIIFTVAGSLFLSSGFCGGLGGCGSLGGHGGLGICKGAGGAKYLSSGRFWIISMFFVGVLAAGTMVVPGVSGSMIMMMIGVYEPLLQTTNGCIRAALSLRMGELVFGCAVLLPYFAGLGMGIFFFARVVEHLLLNHQRQMYRVIMGLVFSSPVVILWDMDWGKVELYQVLGGISLCLLGYVAAAGTAKKDKANG